jgi:hypothetical protein
MKLMRSLFPLAAPVALLASRAGPLLTLVDSLAGILGTGGIFSATIVEWVMDFVICSL